VAYLGFQKGGGGVPPTEVAAVYHRSALSWARFWLVSDTLKTWLEACTADFYRWITTVEIALRKAIVRIRWAFAIVVQVDVVLSSDNNCLRHICNCCWRESVKPLQYFCSNMPMTYQIDQTKLVFWKKMFVNDNTILYSLSRLIRDRFAAVASKMEHCL